MRNVHKANNIIIPTIGYILAISPKQARNNSIAARTAIDTIILFNIVIISTIFYHPSSPTLPKPVHGRTLLVF